MSDIAVATDPAGISRTSDGQITTSPTTETPETTTPTTKEQPTILNAEEAKAPAEPPKEEPKKPDGAPEKYSDYKVPDGYTLDPEVKKEADAMFKGMDLTQANAQKLVDFFTAKTSEAFRAPFEAYQKMTNDWLEESQNHPDLRGKLGPGKEVNVRIAKALDSLGDPKLASDFKQTMDLTGAGNNHAFIRVIDAFAKKFTEGAHVAGNGPAAAGQSAPSTPVRPGAAAAMWPNLPSANR